MSARGCCALIRPVEWDEQIFIFDKKLFAKATTNSFLYMPLNMRRVMDQTITTILTAEAIHEDGLILSEDVSPWHADHYFAVDKVVPGLPMKRLSGTFITKVFEGPYSNVGKWHKQLLRYVKSRHKTPLKTYFFYTTCPECSKIYGKNYVVGFQQIESL